MTLAKIVKRIFYIIYNICRETYIKIKLIFKYVFCKHTFIEKTYYPEKQHKSKIEIFGNQLVHILKYGEINEFYYMYGFDVKGCSYMSDLIDYRSFMRVRNKRNIDSFPDYLCLLRDKILYWMFLKTYGIATPEIIGYTDKGRLYVFSKNTYVPIEKYLKEDNKDVFVKIVDGECGKSVFNLKYKKGLNKFYLNGEIENEDAIISILKQNKYIIQEKVCQHPEINALYSKSINTIRLVTFRHRDTHEIDVLPSVFRVGCNGSYVDNWSQGGIAVGINIVNGTLKKYGFFRPEIAKRVEFHPDSGCKLEGYRIPYFQEAVSQAIFIHSQIPVINSIGWDIAISDSGPIFIEGNDNWEVSLNQACNLDSASIFKKIFH